MLILKNIYISVKNKTVVKGINLKIKKGEIHVLMGPNGSGKSSLAKALMGHPEYKIADVKGEIKNKTHRIVLDSVDLGNLPIEERAKMGLFLAFQNPLAIPGVSVSNLLRVAVNNLSKGGKTKKIFEFRQDLKKKAKILGIKDRFLERGLNDGFSGGEMKKMEMLQLLVLKPKYAIVDEIDTGLDVDALKTVAKAIKNTARNNNTGILLVTHYNRILKYLKPDKVHIMIEGRIVKSGESKLANIVEEKGYKDFYG